MKKVLFSLAILAFAFSANAQKESTSLSFDNSTSYLHAGIGFGGGYYSGSITLPPVSVSYEKAVTDKISVGGIIGYSGSKYSYLSSYDYKYTYLLFGARGNYHFATSDKLDPYAGLTLGYNVVSVSTPSGSQDFNYTAKGSALLFGAQIGANYYFSSNLGAFAELGYGIGVLTIGVTAKF